jgi:hypothetical protein
MECNRGFDVPDGLMKGGGQNVCARLRHTLATGRRSSRTIDGIVRAVLMSVLFDQTTNRCAIIESVNCNASGYSLGSFCATIQVMSHRGEKFPKKR